MMYGTGSYGRGFNTGKVLNIHRSDDLDLSKAVLKLLLGYNFCATYST